MHIEDDDILFLCPPRSLVPYGPRTICMMHEEKVM